LCRAHSAHTYLPILESGGHGGESGGESGGEGGGESGGEIGGESGGEGGGCREKVSTADRARRLREELEEALIKASSSIQHANYSAGLSAKLLVNVCITQWASRGQTCFVNPRGCSKDT